MAFNILEAVENVFSNDLISKISNGIGESEEGVQNTLRAAVPGVLATVLHQSGTPEGSENILNQAKEAENSGILNNLTGLLGGETSNIPASVTNMANNLFGEKLHGLTNLITNYGHAKLSSVKSILSIAAPAVLGVLGRHAAQNNLSASGLGSVIQGQKDNIISAIPHDLNLGGALGLGNLMESLGSKVSGVAAGAGNTVNNVAGEAAGALNSAGSTVKEAVSGVSGLATGAAEEVKKKTGKWILPLIILLIILGIIWYFAGKNHNASQNTLASTADSSGMASADSLSAVAAVSGPVSINVKLPNDTVLNAYQGGIEDQLVSYLNSTDPADSISKNRWFNFDNLNFEKGQAVITGSSMVQIKNIVEILKAYPKVKIKIGGYTDKSGNAASNLKLSQQRADAVASELKKMGSDPTQIVEAKGYGSEFAKADANAPDSLRKLDRHISINVKAK